tara:strand:- start:1129 stop:1425 length:297 start_codon:yes stop_codon:yes gene_type:complete
MNVVKDHIDYLKDNPEGYWFKRKLYGWGWTPARRQGWFVFVAYIAVIIGLAMYVEKYPDRITVDQLMVAIVLLTFLFLAIVWRTGEPPKWQWGQKVND